MTESRPHLEWSHHPPSNRWKPGLQIGKPWDWQAEWPYNLPIDDPAYHNENNTCHSRASSSEQATS
jgi:hypothetical protein